MLKIGRVPDGRDATAGGKLRIIPLDSDGEAIGSPIQAIPCTPNIGDGHGFLSVPGPGSFVVYMEAPPITIQKVRVPVQYIWLGAIALPTMQTMGRSSMSFDKNDPDESNNTQKDFYNRTPSDSKQIYDSGIPEGQNMYKDNDLPQQDIWKHRSGHKVIMSHKITNRGTHDNGVRIQSASGKLIHINDGHPAAGKHDRIVIKDEKSGNELGPNKLEIISGGKNKDTAWLTTDKQQVHITNKGGQYHTIMKGTQDQRRDNCGRGNIVDKAYKGNHEIEAEKNIIRVAFKENIVECAKKGDIHYNAEDGNILIEAANTITLACGSSKITLSPGSINVESPVISLNGTTSVSGGTTTIADGTVLDSHSHIGNLGFPVSPPF